MKFNTKTIHGGQHIDPAFGSVMQPIYQTSTYAQKSPGNNLGYEYSRSSNPTRKALEKNISSLENGKYGYAFASGMAAIDCILRLLKPGDEIICSNDIYGGTFRLFNQIYTRQNFKFIFSDLQSLKELEKLITKNTKMIWIETPSNPMMNIIDIKKITDFSKKNKLLTVVDNTFASPYLQTPLDLGADIVTHSATKYLGGHSDILAGTVCGSHELISSIKKSGLNFGSNISEYVAWLLERSIKTLQIRVKTQNKNAHKIAKFLEKSSYVKNVNYPGLKSHPSHELAKKQMKGCGGIISFYIKADMKKTKAFLENCQIFSLAESLGGVESLIEHPALMTHASISKVVRDQIGITDGLVRLSVGIESADDLINDLDKALN